MATSAYNKPASDAITNHNRWRWATFNLFAFETANLASLDLDEH